MAVRECGWIVEGFLQVDDAISIDNSLCPIPKCQLITNASVKSLLYCNYIYVLKNFTSKIS